MPQLPLLSSPGIGGVAWTEGVDVDVYEARLEHGDSQVVLVDVCHGWRHYIEALKACLAAVVAGDEAG